MSNQEKLKVLTNFAVNDDKLNFTNLIKLPNSFLKSYKDKPFPLYFKLYNLENCLKMYVGVQDFTAEEDYVIIPQWIFDYLGLKNNQQEIGIKYVNSNNILKGDLVIFKPLEKEFFSINNFKEVLTNSLNKFSLLYKNSTIELELLGSKYHLLIEDIIQSYENVDFENLPDDVDFIDDLICIIDIDLKVEFNNIFINDNDSLTNNDTNKSEESMDTCQKELSLEELRKKRLAFYEKFQKKKNEY